MTGDHKIYLAACKACGLPDPIPEYQFAKGRRWRIDWYFELGDRKVALEIEGGIFSGGRHVRGSGFKKDMEKYNAAAAMGILLVRCAPKEQFTNDTMRTISLALGVSNDLTK